MGAYSRFRSVRCRVWNLPKIVSFLFEKRVIEASCLLLAVAVIRAASDEGYLRKPPEQWTEEEALKVLNDSPWAKTVKPSTQDTACGFKNPAIPGEFSEDQAEKLEILVPTGPSLPVKPDGAEYLIRWQSAKPMQAAVQRLIALGDQWKEYGFERHKASGDSTDLEKRQYFDAGMIGIRVILKHKGPDGESFLDYFFDAARKTWPAQGIILWPCAGLKTEEGVTYAQAADGGHGDFAITMFFPSSIHGKPLITKPEEKVEFRCVAKQRVFETTFTIRAADLVPDRSEPVLYYPTVVTDLKLQPEVPSQAER
jgi:hypothetical protein